MTVALSFIAFLGKRYIETENEKQANEGNFYFKLVNISRFYNKTVSLHKNPFVSTVK